MIKPPKPKKQPICKWCLHPFARSNSLQKVCTWTCGLKLAESERVKKEQKAFKAETAVMKKAIKDKDRAYWIKKAQAAFNPFIRERDRDKPCVSCGVINPPITTGGQWDAGHFKTRGAYPELRFNEDNCHKQCKKCNGGSNNHSSKAKTVSEYFEDELIKRIGIERVEALKAPHPPAKWSIDELKEIEAHYKAKLKELR